MMNMAVEKEWTGKNVAVIGLGVSNLALIKFLQAAGAKISGRDLKTREELGERFAELESLGIELILGREYLGGLNAFDIVMVSPGVPKDLPELVAVKQMGKQSSEISLVFQHSQAPIYGITGSSGKTTTTTLVGEMLKESGLKTYVGGNIGTPLINELVNMRPSDRVLLELSSFQLEDLTKSPHGAIITNITENHLDFHHTLDNYIRAKEQIYRHQNPGDFLVLNYDDPLTRRMAREARGQVYFFSLTTPVQRGAYCKGEDFIFVDKQETVSFLKRSELALPGEHNVANFLAAAIFSHLMGANWDAIIHVGKTFSGVPHRLEFVLELDGVRYYNDSVATTPDRTLAALRSFQEPIILIAGGSDKQLSFDQLGHFIHGRVKYLILLGVTAPKIRQAVLAAGDFPIDLVDTMEEAVERAGSLAQAGDVVLLSPACASFDQYRNYMARGAHFRELVRNLRK